MKSNTGFFPACLGALLALIIAPASGLGDDNLAVNEILQKAQANYDAMLSYSDEGQVVTTMNGEVCTTLFTTRLARPNFYRIEWQQSDDVYHFVSDDQGQAVWSAGTINFLQTTSYPRWQYTRETALAQASIFSTGATATLPRIFYHAQWSGEGEQLEGFGLVGRQQADEKLGRLDCYVFTHTVQGQSRTVWLDKESLLVRQVRTVTSAAAMQAALRTVTSEAPDLVVGYTSIETHTNIQVNLPLTRSDFLPTFTGWH